MKLISNSTVADLQKLIPIVCDNLPPKQQLDLKTQNAVRRLHIILKKLNKLKNGD